MGFHIVYVDCFENAVKFIANYYSKNPAARYFLALSLEDDQDYPWKVEFQPWEEICRVH